MSATRATTTTPLLHAAGFLSVFIVPALLAASSVIDEPTLTFGTVMPAFPLARPVFGAHRQGAAPEWNERIAVILDRLP